MVNGGSKAMTKFERALLWGLAEEIVLQLRSRLAEIEQLHPRESALGIATFQERLWRIEELLNTVKKDGDHTS
jgi:threonine synthase